MTRPLQHLFLEHSFLNALLKVNYIKCEVISELRYRPQTANYAACGCLLLPPPCRSCKLLLMPARAPAVQEIIVRHANSNCQLRWDTKTCLIAGWAEARQGGERGTVSCLFVCLCRRWCTSKTVFTYVSKSAECVRSGWNLWVFVGVSDDFYRHVFTPGRPCPGLLKTCWVPSVRNGAPLQDHAKAPSGLAGVAYADKV